LKKNLFELVFYHFHNFKFLTNDKVEFGGYKLRRIDLKMFYKPYLIHLEKIKNKIVKIDGSYDYHGTSQPKTDWKTPLRNLKRRLKRSYNIYDKNYILGL